MQVVNSTGITLAAPEAGVFTVKKENYPTVSSTHIDSEVNDENIDDALAEEIYRSLKKHEEDMKTARIDYMSFSVTLHAWYDAVKRASARRKRARLSNEPLHYKHIEKHKTLIYSSPKKPLQHETALGVLRANDPYYQSTTKIWRFTKNLLQWAAIVGGSIAAFYWINH